MTRKTSRSRLFLRVLTGLVVLLVALVVAGYALLANFDVEAYRDVIQAEVKKATGRDLTLEGPVELKVSLTPAITVEQVGFGNADWGSRPELARVKRFELEMALLPLLSGEVQVKRLVLVEPDILIETDAEGRSNLDFGAGEAASADDGAEAATELAVAVDSVVIEKGMVTLVDGATGERRAIALESLEASAEGLASPITLAAEGSYNNQAFSLEGTLGSFQALNSGPFPVDLVAQAGGADVTVKGEIAQPRQGQGVDLAITAEGEEIGDLGALAAQPVPALGPYKVALRVGQEGATYRLTDLDASLAGVQASGNAALALGGEAPSIEELNVRVETAGDSLAELGEPLGLELPAVGPYEIAFTLAEVEGAPPGQAFRLEGLAAKLGESDLAGEAEISLAGPRPSLTGNFTSTRLDLAALQEAAGGGSEEAGGAGGDSPYVFTDEPLPLVALQAADASIGLTAAEVILQEGMVMSALQVALELKDGRLAVQPVTATLSGGEIAAELALDGAASPPTLATALTVTQLDYGQLLKAMGEDETVAGRLDMAVDLSGAGASPRAIASGLNGELAMESSQGVINNRLLKIVAVGLGDVLGPLMGGDDEAKLNCMVVKFDVAQGQAKSKAMVVDTEVFTISGGGLVDLRSEELDLAFDTETREASIASLAVPFNVTGTLKNPSVAPDPLGTALGIAKTAGVVINPVAGLGLLIGDKIASSGEDNPCVVAVAERSGSGGLGVESVGSVAGGVAEGAASAAQGAAEGAASAAGEAAEGAGKAVEGAVEGVSEGLKSLFGD